MTSEEDRREEDLKFNEINHRLQKCEDGNLYIIEQLDKLVIGMFGDGEKQGVFTRVALAESSLVRAWVFIGGISMSILTVAFFVIRSGLIHG